MWSTRRTVKFTATAITAVAIAAGAIAVVAPHPEPVLPVSDPVVQASFESKVANFLSTVPQPVASDFGYTTEGQNTYWRAMAEWYDSEPWNAVAGQWGCEGSQSATFNPANDSGVVVAAYGGVSTCGGFELDDPAILSTPQTRTDALKENPDLLKQLEPAEAER